VRLSAIEAERGDDAVQPGVKSLREWGLAGSYSSMKTLARNRWITFIGRRHERERPRHFGDQPLHRLLLLARVGVVAERYRRRAIRMPATAGEAKTPRKAIVIACSVVMRSQLQREIAPANIATTNISAAA
jgi:hypothetical protein